MYQLSHPLDRPGQQEAMDWILNSDKKYNILCAPTGFGKSPLAAYASIKYRTMALVLHKSLQTANYEEQYDFEVLFGKGNYPCEDKTDKPKTQSSFLPSQLLTAYDCGEIGCECPYQLQYECCMRSNRVSLNYAKFLMSKPFTRDYEPQYLFLDEAHNLTSIVTEFVGCALDWDNEFLQCNGGIKPKVNGRLNLNEAMNLFRQCARAVDANEVEQRDDLVRWRKWHRLRLKIKMTNDILITSDLRDWYFEANDDQLIIKPLTAKYHFKRLFGMADKVILMSATIKPSIAERLGLEDDEWGYHEAPNVWPVPSRLIYDLGGPAINYKSSDEDKQEQASLIASILQTDKTGTIHVMSKSQANQLKYRLDNIVDSDIKFHLPKIGIGTDNQLQEWYDVRQPGIYCISWCFHEGVDLGGDDIGVLGKVPYTSLASNYSQAVKDYDPQWYRESAAYTTEQILGRPRRGVPEHYGRYAKMVFIADSAWHGLKTLLSDNVRKAIRKWNGNV